MVVSKNAYLNMSEMKENAEAIYYYLIVRGWSRSAISAMLGNMQTESTINPGIWQSLTINPALGYGLVQWTPSTKVINWLTLNGYNIDDLYGQLERIQYELDNNIQWISTSAYPMTFSQFKSSNESPEYLAQAFLRNYERPRNQNQPLRSTQARFWFDYLSEIDQLAMHPFDYINISQGEGGVYSHAGTYCIDYVGTYDRYPYYCPVDMMCIHQANNGEIRIWKSVNEVLCADGQKRQFFMSCIHDEVDWLPNSWVNDVVFPQGSIMGYTGVAGNATGDHAHFQVMLGDDYQGFYTNPEGAISLIGTELHQYDVFFFSTNTEVVNDYGYPWIVVDNENPQPPKPTTGKSLIPLWLGGAVKI